MKPYAALSVDLDDNWSYLKTHGDPDWQLMPSYLELVIPRLLDLFEEFGLTVTVFVVGRDAAIDSHHQAIRSISKAGHEIGNHSYEHEPWLADAPLAAVRDELEAAHAAISEASQVEPVGFRGPGFATSPRITRALTELGYRYDASALPTWIGPLARAYYFRSTDLTESERDARRALFGNWRDVLQRNVPRRLNQPGAPAYVPVTTTPIIRVPFHISYVHYLAGVSESVALAYFRFSLALCRATATPPSLLIHPLDVLSSSEVFGLEFFPAMNQSAAIKVDRLRRLLALLTSQYSVGPVVKLAEGLAAPGRYPLTFPPATG